MIGIIVIVSCILMFMLAVYLVYESYCDLRFKSYKCEKCRMSFSIPREESHHVDHDCNKKQSVTKIFWE